MAIKRLWQTYLNSYRGLSKETWILALVMLINRSGAMVIPFLGVYMTSQLGFDLKQAGLALSCFGIGSIVGSFVGGWMTDKVGHYQTQVLSLFFSVPVFFLFPLFKSFFTLCLVIIALSFITELLRPANSASVSYYAKAENLTKAFSLNRMAINLGWSIGPAMGGILAGYSYNFLFFVNGTMVLLAGIVFALYFKGKEGKDVLENINDSPFVHTLQSKTAYQDRKFIFFVLLLTLYATVFYQFLNSLPLFYKDVYLLSEINIGYLLGFSGLMVFSLEMIIVDQAEKHLSIKQNMIIGTLLCAISFLCLMLPIGIAILYIAMFFLSVSEILVLPFSSTICVTRSSYLNRGSYMALHSLAFSAAHVLSPLYSTQVAENYGFNMLWVITGFIMIVTAYGFHKVMQRM